MNSTFFADTVSETLLIPLYMRAKESRRGEKAIIRDPVAERLVEQIPYDYSKFDGAVLSEVGCNVRAWYLDNVVRDYVKSHVNPIIVNLGCGFDARTQRTTIESSARYYSLDLPEVIAARDRLLPPAENETYVPGSMFDEKRMAELKSANPEAEFLFIAEGVVMYFREDEIKSLFQKLLKHFPGYGNNADTHTGIGHYRLRIRTSMIPSKKFRHVSTGGLTMAATSRNGIAVFN